MTKYFYDTEFIEDSKTIDLISIGIVAEDGREYYAVNHDMPIDRISKNAWLVKNVVSSLPLGRQQVGLEDLGKALVGALSFKLDQSSSYVKPGWVIANEVREFLLAGDTDPELWAYYGAYDHVVHAQLFGSMAKLPKGLPMYTNNIVQEANRQGKVDQLPKQESGLHNALENARHVREMHRILGELDSTYPHHMLDGPEGGENDLETTDVHLLARNLRELANQLEQQQSIQCFEISGPKNGGE